VSFFSSFITLKISETASLLRGWMSVGYLKPKLGAHFSPRTIPHEPPNLPPPAQFPQSPPPGQNPPKAFPSPPPTNLFYPITPLLSLVDKSEQITVFRHINA